VSCICTQLALDNYRDYVHANAVHPLVQLALGDVRKALVDAKLTMNKYVHSSYSASSCASYMMLYCPARMWSLGAFTRFDVCDYD